MKQIFILLCLLMAPELAAHQLKTVALKLDVLPGGQVQASFKSPLGSDGRPASVIPMITPACNIQGDARTQRSAEKLVRYWDWSCPGGLAGREIRLEGLNVTAPDGIVNVTYPDGKQAVYLLDRHQPAVTIASAGQAGHDRRPLAGYLTVGIEHILLGPDHLLFVFCLLLILKLGGAGLRQLLVTITAFTVAHSLTLGLSVLGGWSLPATPVEAVIALSILLLAVELAHQARKTSRSSLTIRHPEIVAFAFGLLHGFGFAGALTDIGLPDAMQGWALLLFNLGVEAGQLLFVTTMLLLAVVIKRYTPSNPARAMPAVVTGAGAVSAYWFIDRLMPVFVL